MRNTHLRLMLAILLLAPLSSFSESSNRHEFKVAKRAKFALTIPSSMAIQSQEKQGEILTLNIGPTEGNVYEILISALKSGSRGEPTLSDKEIQYLVRLRGTQLLDTSVETELKMMQLTGVHGVGYLYTLTDKREELPSGEYRYLCQGIFMLGNVQLSATLLTDSPDEEVVVPFFEILRTAESVK